MSSSIKRFVSIIFFCMIGMSYASESPSKRIKIDPQDLFCKAILYQNIPKVEDILRAHADEINVNRLITVLNKKIFGKTPVAASPLMYAVNFDNYPLVDILLQNGAQVNSVCPLSHPTPLLRCVARNTSQGIYRILPRLLAAGANAQAVTAYGDNALHLLVGNTKVTQDQAVVAAGLLIDAGCDVHHYNRGLLTPLHLAAALDKSTLVECLLEHGAQPAAPGFDGRTPLSLTLPGFDVIETLRNAQAGEK